MTSRFMHLFTFAIRRGVWPLQGLLLWLVWSPASASHAEDGPSPSPAWQYKFTPSRYITSGETTGTDVNLRANAGEHTWWVGHYQRGQEFQQSRMGYERTRPWAWGQWTLSLQAATHGFAGGALSSQIGSSTLYGLVGYGRTNAQTYYNLNFDPNDAWTLGVGGNAWGSSTFSLFRVQDNRLDTEQRNTHAVWRWPLSDQQRWTLDLAHKRGRPEAGLAMTQGHSLSLAYDYRQWFVHWVKDQHVNYSDADQTRLSVGLRF
jgi:hypothetical protein